MFILIKCLCTRCEYELLVTSCRGREMPVYRVRLCTASRHKLAADINWLPSPYFEIVTYLKYDNILKLLMIKHP